MEVINRLYPSKTQIEDFKNFPTDQPIKMVNLLKFKDKAVYEDGRKTNLSGVEAYSVYATEVVNHLEKVGGKTLFFGEVKGLLIGEVEESWEWVAIAEYPSASAMYKMLTDSDYRESEKHRSAGLQGQLNIITQ
tara:strand:- start:242 stop:643 length:402 start_codon:yes stop_codon:yes gene_type:complete